MQKGKSDDHTSAEEPTGEFTFLSVDKRPDVAPLGGDDEIEIPSIDVTRSSLRRLESDIRQLHSKWQNVERELSARAANKSQLITELGEKDSRIQRLEEDLRLAKVEKMRLTNAVGEAEEQRNLRQQRDDELQGRFNEQEAKLLQMDLTIDALDEQLVANDEEIGSLRGQLEEITADRDKLQTKFAMTNNKNPDSEAVFQAMQTEIETLESELCAKRDLIEVLAHGQSVDTEMVDTFDQGGDRTVNVDAGTANPGSNGSTSNLNILPFRTQHLMVAIDPDGGEELRYPLYKKEMTIGRSKKADIQVPNVYISRMHARISRQGSKAIIQDIGSTNGFLINSEAARRRELVHGDRVHIGSMEFKFIEVSVSA